jgi:CRP/FNR family cyclic AMP-dependent transcriptional regulator
MPVQTLEPILAQLPIFEGLKKHYLDLLTGCAANAVFKDGSFLFHEGDEARQFYIIREGKVALEVRAPGREPMTVQTVEVGDVVGWSWLFPPHRWHFTARVIGNTRAITLDGECLRGKCETDHDLGYEFLKRFSHIMIRRLEATRLQLLDLYGR